MGNIYRVITADELQVISEMTIRLTELRQKECKHLSIENFAPELFSKLVEAYRASIVVDYGSQQVYMKPE